jgi:hypothetical protein
MAFIRCTNSTYGVYEKYKDPVTGKQRERCLCRFGPYPSAVEAYAGYRAEIAMAWWTYRQTRHQYGDWARHERVLAMGVVDRLVWKLADVVDYMRSQGDSKVRAATWLFDDLRPASLRSLEAQEAPQ